MIVWIILIATLLLFRTSFCRSGISEDYISKQNSNAIRGVFILLILASHFSKYVPSYTSPIDVAYWKVRVILGQCVVSMFLFYSGYGVMLSFSEKEGYHKQFFRKRLLPTLLIYDLSEILFFFVQRGLGKSYSFQDFLLSMLAWKSFGNDNWYIFIILILYFITWLSVSLISSPQYRHARQVATLFLGTVVFAKILICSGKGMNWYNTLFCFPLGSAFYCCKAPCERFLSKTENYLLVLLLTLLAYRGMHRIWHVHLVFYILTVLLFAVLVLLLTMKLHFKSVVLTYCGENLQELFLVHRIPMILLRRVPFIKQRIHLYFALSVLGAFFVAFLFKQLIRFLQGRLAFPR